MPSQGCLHGVCYLKYFPYKKHKMKKCSKCKVEKQLACFSLCRASKDGFQYYCKDCQKEKTSAWIQSNPEKVKVFNVRWREANPEKSKDIKSNWYKANAEKVKCLAKARSKTEKAKALTAAWQAKNKEKSKENIAAWHKANPEAGRIYEQNRRIKKRIADNKLSRNLAGKLLILQKGKCACCKQQLGKKYHLDHIMPLALGGTNTDSNIQLLRSTCNQQKHAKHPVDFMQQRGFLL